ncbi:MAG: TolC family protein [Acidobacteriaceae bacterium]|jgi:multidrug efflux system outer membrane protein|nr:TolC family protein [Acidobacteriaceae bacterium]
MKNVLMLTLVVNVVMAGALAGTSDAQTAAPLRVTLDDAMTRGLASSARIDEARARQDAAEAVVDERIAATRPTAMASAGYTRTNHVQPFGITLPNGPFLDVYPDIPNNFSSRIGASWPLFTFGRSEAAVAAARSEAAASGSDVDVVRTALRTEISQAFWQLYLAHASAVVVNESVARMTNQLDVTREQFANGLLVPSDVERVRAELVHQQMLVTQSAANVEIAEAVLGRLIGVAPGTHIETNVEPSSPTHDSEPDALIQQALDARSDVQALRSRMDAAAERRRLAEAGNKPSVALAGGVDYAKPNPRNFPRQDVWGSSWDVGVNASVPLFDGGRRNADVAESIATERALKARADELASTIGLEIRQRLAEIRAARAALEASAAGIAAATEAERVLGDRFRVGVATVSDTLDARLAVVRAQLERDQAAAALGLAEARLERALGR